MKNSTVVVLTTLVVFGLNECRPPEKDDEPHTHQESPVEFFPLIELSSTGTNAVVSADFAWPVTLTVRK